MDNAEGNFQQCDFHVAEGYCLNKRSDFPQRQSAIKSVFASFIVPQFTAEL